MMNLSEFNDSLALDHPGEEMSIQLKSLWYDAKGEWSMAHDQVDQLTDLHSARVHAYLHRKEGDLWNADYWYSRAKVTRPDISLKQEWEELVAIFISYL